MLEVGLLPNFDGNPAEAHDIGEAKAELVWWDLLAEGTSNKWSSRPWCGG